MWLRLIIIAGVLMANWYGPLYLPADAREILSTRQFTTVSEWAAANRRLSARSSAEPGLWRNERTPYLIEPMNTRSDPTVERADLMTSSQIGKTECINNMIGYGVDQDPGPAMLVEPREQDFRAVIEERLKPMIEESPALKRHLRKPGSDRYEMDRMALYFAGANSPAALASRPVRDLFRDEVDKYARFSGREADPLELCEERTKTFWNRFILTASTPTTEDGYIWQSYQQSDRRRYWVPCPHCGKYQVLVFIQLKFPEDERDPARIRQERLAWYECERCEGQIEDRHKPEMLARGVWLAEGEEVTDKGIILKRGKARNPHAGYWLNSLYSPWLTFAEIAAKFLESKDFPNKLMNFRNSWLAECWKDRVQNVEEETVQARLDSYRQGDVPRGVELLTAGVDVQERCFYFVVRGWGVGEESWLIREGQCYSWEELVDALIGTPYIGEDGRAFGVTLACVDSGYRTDEVYDHCRQHAEVLRPIKGQAKQVMGYRSSVVDRDHQGRLVHGGLLLWHLAVNFYKDKIARLFEGDRGQPGFWHLPGDVDSDYIQQFTAEEKVTRIDRKTGFTKTEWRVKSIGRQNHLWDCEVYAVAAADMANVRFLRSADEMARMERERQKRAEHSQRKVFKWRR